MRIAPSKLGALLLLAAACNGGTDSVEPPVAPEPDFRFGRGPTILVQGAGSVDLSAAGVDPASFLFWAHRKADGSAAGFFWQRRSTPTGTVEFAGRVTCLTTDPAFPGRARIAGVVTENKSSNPAFMTENHQVGDDVWFRVQDGDDAADGLDRSTTYGFKPTLVNTSAEYCALPFDGLPQWNPASIFPLGHGNIRVWQRP